MVSLFHVPSVKIDTSKYSSLLHDPIVTALEQRVAKYVGAKYAVSLNSATSAIFLSLLRESGTTIPVPSVIPPVVLNAILTSGNTYTFVDDVAWVGDMYTLAEFTDYKIIDSAQRFEAAQFSRFCDPQDLMIFSFYPTKPVSGADGGMIVSDDKEKIENIRTLALNGMTFAPNNWDRTITTVGYKMYMSAVQAAIVHSNMDNYEIKAGKMSYLCGLYNKYLKLNNTSKHLYRINVDAEHRDDFRHYLEAAGISSGLHYAAMHLHPVYTLGTRGLPLPKSELDAVTTVSLPFHEKLTTACVRNICRVVHDYKP